MNKLQIICLSLLAMTTGCTNEMDDTSSTDNQGVAKIQATIGEPSIIRATTGNGDNISYRSFEPNDAIGLFASQGLSATNMKLTYSEGSFKNADLQWTGGNAKQVYAYFPYTAYQKEKEEINIWREKKNDQDPKWEEGFNDILLASNDEVPEGAIINLNFTHQFAMLVIKRGKGFDKVPSGTLELDDTSKDVTITLNQPVGKTASITYSNDAPSITLNSTDGVTVLPTNEGKYNEANVYYVIIPVGKISEKSVNVTSITLCNNLGRKMSVAPSITPAKNNKYIIEVKMLDNQAVASPIEIVRWDNEEIIMEKPIGIKDEEDFTTWAAAYNDTNLNETERFNTLNNYGSCDQGKWTFLLLEDIDLTDETFNGITHFTDIFDGQGHSISGINIHEENADDARPTGFVRTLSGTIKSLILKDATIYGKSDIGGFAGKATSGAKVSKCQLTGASIIFGTSKVGAFIGNEVGESAIENCTQAPTVIIKTVSSN